MEERNVGNVIAYVFLPVSHAIAFIDSVAVVINDFVKIRMPFPTNFSKTFQYSTIFFISNYTVHYRSHTKQPKVTHTFGKTRPVLFNIRSK